MCAVNTVLQKSPLLYLPDLDLDKRSMSTSRVGHFTQRLEVIKACYTPLQVRPEKLGDRISRSEINATASGAE